MYKNKRKNEIKKVLDLSKLTLFGIRPKSSINNIDNNKSSSNSN